MQPKQFSPYNNFTLLRSSITWGGVKNSRKAKSFSTSGFSTEKLESAPFSSDFDYLFAFNFKGFLTDLDRKVKTARV